MIKKKFCLVGIDPDFEDLIAENSRYYVGFFTSIENKSYKNKIKNLAKKIWKIGKNCIIGAGSVVITNVNDYEIVAGFPARTITKNKN